MQTLIIHSKTLNPEQTTRLESLGEIKAVANHFRIDLAQVDSAEIQSLSQDLSIDINLLPQDYRAEDIKLVISDMDSTLIGIECVDEIADMMNLKKEVSEITEAAMRGELDFEASLRQRVALLEGLDTSALQRVYDERLFLNPGAEEWLKGLKEKGIAFALVSGGFTFFTDRLKEKLGLDFARSNVLGEENNQLTGNVVGGIIGAQAKADFLHELCGELNISPQQVIAIGDGANDLLMMKEAGLSIAYHAKPKVQEEADTALNESGLDKVLDFLA